MCRFLIFFSLLFFPALCFSQVNTIFRVVGNIPPIESSKLYQIQVGAFREIKNAKWAFERLDSTALDSIYENHREYTRVIVVGIPAGNVAACLEKIKALGFREIWIKEDTSRLPVNRVAVPVSTAAVPVVSSTEIGFRTIKVGETRNVVDLAKNKNIIQWISSTPSAFTVDSNGDVKGLNIGNGFITINENEYISIAVVPAENFYVVQDSQAAFLPPNSRTGNSSSEDIAEYKTEPTFRLAYRFNNKGENKGASGRNGGIDILAQEKIMNGCGRPMNKVDGFMI